MSAREVNLDSGAKMIHVILGQGWTVKRAFSEWVDNSFDAGASWIKIRKRGTTLEVSDDGAGCSDLMLMQSFGKSVPVAGKRSSMYGFGGAGSQVFMCQATLSEVISRTVDSTRKVVCDWEECLRTDRLSARLSDSQPIPSLGTGTTITISNCRTIRNVEKIAQELGYSFSEMLKHGKKITIDIDGAKTKVKAFEWPEMDEQVELDFEIGGHKVYGFCGLVKRGVVNPYPGWSVHWGHRFVGQFHDPADGRPANRICGAIFLPATWKNIGLTKDFFIDDPYDLWDAITDRCREIIDAASAESGDIELNITTQAVEGILGEILGTGRIKGARPGSTGLKGTVEPTGRGGEHRNFRTSQPGDKADGNVRLPKSAPESVRLMWDETLGEKAYSFVVSGNRTKTAILTLNSSVARISEFRNDPSKLATFCLGHIAHEIAYGPDGTRLAFPEFREMDYQDLYRDFLFRKTETTPKAKKRRRAIAV